MKTSLRVSLTYFVLGVIWILFSDYFLGNTILHLPTLTFLQSVKGWVFVLFSSILIYFLLEKEIKREYQSLREKNRIDLVYQNILKQVQDAILIYNTSTKKIELISEQSSKFFEQDIEKMKRDPMLLVERLHPEDRERIFEIWKNHLTENYTGLLYRLHFPDGRIKWGLENRIYIFDPLENEGRSISITTDLTDYLEKQSQLEKSLRDNKTLLTEVHHRVKNNLAVIISFLQLQAYNAPRESAIVLEQSIARIKAIALVHEKLYSSRNLSSIDLASYIEGLVENIKLMYMRMDISIELDVVSKEISPIEAIPLGLIVTELLTNSFRHAFPSTDEASILIRLVSNDEGYMELIYKDNGKGFPTGINIQNYESVGLSVIFSLCSQLSGKVVAVDSKPNQGVMFHFVFENKEGNQSL